MEQEAYRPVSPAFSKAPYQIIREMIERYTIKFGPAVSQKELEKALHEPDETPAQSNLHKMKARIEVIGDFEDLKKVRNLIEELRR